MAWSSTTIAGKAADAFVPSAPPRFGILWLSDPTDEHPDASFFGGHPVACVAPHGGASWWTDHVWTQFDGALTAEQHVVENVYPWMRQQWGLAANCVAIAGVGAGGHGALRIAFKQPQLFSVVAALDAAVDQHEAFGHGNALDDIYLSREHCRQDSAVLHIHPARQPAHIWFASERGTYWHRGNDRLHEKLSALGVAHEFVAAGSIATLIQFVLNSLTRESRRLL